MTFTLDAINAGSPAPSDLIKDSDTRRFKQDVLDASRQVPVIVDFWAPWCGPCKQLGPALEKVVRQAAGKVKLVKINVDENQQLAAQMRVQSIPAVFAFVNGQPVDGFMGALPESQLKQFVDKLGGKGGMAEELEAAMAAAREAFEQQDLQAAAEIYRQIIQVDREHVGALAGLAKCQIEAGDFDNAKATLALVPPSKTRDPEVLSATAALELAQNPVNLSEAFALAEKVSREPDDYQARLELALVLNGAGKRSEAADHLLHVIRKDRAWNDEAARKQLLQFFEAWGHKDEATQQGRRKLSSILFS